MNVVRSVDTPGVSPAGPARGMFLKGPADVFATVFESTRQSANRLADVMTRRAREVSTSGRGQERLAYARSESGPGSADRPGSGRRTRPDRVDRLRSLVRDADRAVGPADQAPSEPEKADAKLARDRAADVEQDPLTEAGEGAVHDPPAPRGSDEPAADATVLNQEQVAEAAANPAPQTEGTTPQGGEEVVVRQMPGQLPESAAGTTSTTGGSQVLSGTPVVESVVNLPQPGQQNQGTGRETAAGPFSEAAQTGAGKPGEGAARPNAPSVDFQNVLQGAGRSREPSATLRAPAAPAVTGGNPRGGGINLNESQSLTELARIVRAQVGSRHSTLVLHLEPPELGQLRIDVRMHDQTLTLRLEAQTLAGHEALQGRLSELRTALEQHGIQLNQVEVEFRPPLSPAGGAQDSNAQHYSAGQGGESGWSGPGGHPEAGGGGDPSGSAPDPNEIMTPSGGDGLWGGGQHDGVERPAELGVDLVV